MSFFSSLSHIGHAVLDTASKASSVYTTTSTAVGLLEDASEVALLGIVDDVDNITGFIKTKVKNNGKAVIKHFADTDGDGILTKADDLLAKTKDDLSSLGILDDAEGELHSIFGTGATLMFNGLEEASEAAQSHYGFVSDAVGDVESSLGIFAAVSAGLSIYSKTNAVLSWL